MMRMIVDGQPFDNFKTLSFSRSMEDLTSQFNFTASDADATEFPIKRRAKVEIVINANGVDVPMLTGWIETITPNEDANSHDVTIQGRGAAQDFLDSTLEASSVELTTPVTLTTVIEKTLAAVNLDLKVINTIAGEDIEPYSEEELVSCKAGQGAFAFCELYARKRQVLISEDAEGNIIYGRSTGIEIPFQLINRKGDMENNTVISATATYDDSKRYHTYKVVSQANVGGLNFLGEPSVEDAVAVENNAEVIDDEIRPSRVLILVAENASTPEQSTKRAQWEANIRKARSRTYSATVQGFIDPNTGDPFVPNRIVQVQDDDLDINAKMLIKSVSMSLDVSGGSLTSFDLVEQNAYSLEINEPKPQKDANPVGNIFAQ